MLLSSFWIASCFISCAVAKTEWGVAVKLGELQQLCFWYCHTCQDGHFCHCENPQDCSNPVNISRLAAMLLSSFWIASCVAIPVKITTFFVFASSEAAWRSSSSAAIVAGLLRYCASRNDWEYYSQRQSGVSSHNVENCSNLAGLFFSFLPTGAAGCGKYLSG